MWTAIAIKSELIPHSSSLIDTGSYLNSITSSSCAKTNYNNHRNYVDANFSPFIQTTGHPEFTRHQNQISAVCSDDPRLLGHSHDMIIVSPKINFEVSFFFTSSASLVRFLQLVRVEPFQHSPVDLSLELCSHKLYPWPLWWASTLTLSGLDRPRRQTASKE